jgi:NAD(P) transhydrogenase subunit alpha
MGAIVHACDIRPEAIEQAKSLCAKIVDLGVPEDISVGEGGYANALPAKWLKTEKEIIAGAVKDMDIVFLSALVPGKHAPILVTEDMVKTMKPGSVIVDISIDQGGNCEVTDPGEVTEVHGIIINGIKNIPGRLPVSATWMFANNSYNFLKHLTRDGNVEIDRTNEIVASTLTTFNGEVVHDGTLEAMNEGK